MHVLALDTPELWVTVVQVAS
uniref:Uncharacterized protein n=1 Tax=Anguilla anguilla TaxID=7936 RepID=A0A0E9P9L5_ANGAN